MPGIEDALANAGANPEWNEVENFFMKKDRHYAKAYLEEQAKYEAFHEETRTGIHGCKVQHAAVSHLSERLTALVVQVDTDTRAKVMQQRQERHTMETRLEKLVEEKVVDVRGLMVEEQKSRQTGDVYTKEVTNEICHIYNDLEQAKQYRLQKSEKLQEVVSQKLDEITVAISAEKKMREESTNTVLELFGQMGTKMQQEIDAVKSERKESTDRLIQLMEVVLPHLEQARLNHVKLLNERKEDKASAAALFADLGIQAPDSRKSKKMSMVGGVGAASFAAAARQRSSSKGGEQRASVSQMTMDKMRKSLPVLKGTEDLVASVQEQADEEDE